MKNLRCLLALLLILSGLLAIPIQAASAPDDVKAMIDYLSRSGIPEEYLESLTAEDIAEMYERCFGKEIIFNTHPSEVPKSVLLTAEICALASRRLRN